MTPRPGWIACVRLGWRAAWRERRLVLLVWLLFLGVALLAAAPAWRWWNATLSLAPEGDRLLDGLNAPLLRELSHYDRSPTWAIAFAPLSAFMLAMLVLNPFVAGGLLTVLTGQSALTGQAEPRSLIARVFAGGSRYYWLFLKLSLLAGVVGLLLTALFLFVVMPIAHIASTNNLEQLYLFASGLIPVALAIAFWLTSLLLDIARIRAMHTSERRALRALLGGLRFAWRHAGATLAVGVTFALLTGLAFVVYFAVSSAFTPKSWIAILLAIVWQQTLSLTRTGLRLATLAAQVELIATREPPPPPALLADIEIPD
jgi:hypothetical protein